MKWSSTAAETLRELWPRISASKIADQLNVTRNAVIGKANRLGLSNTKVHSTESQRVLARLSPQQPKRRRMLSTRAPTPPRLSVVTAPGKPITLMELTSTTCRWPIEVDGASLYCGAEVDKGSYCHGHVKLAYQTIQRTLRQGGHGKAG